jgi:hypothetical protein
MPNVLAFVKFDRQWLIYLGRIFAWSADFSDSRCRLSADVMYRLISIADPDEYEGDLAGDPSG